MSTTEGTGELLAETTSRSSTPDGDKDSLRTPLPPDKDGHTSVSSPVLTDGPHSELTMFCGSRRILTQYHSTFNVQHWNRAAAPVSSIAKTVAARLPSILFAALSPQVWAPFTKGRRVCDFESRISPSRPRSKVRKATGAGLSLGARTIRGRGYSRFPPRFRG